ncbi:Type II restriction/modification system, DNA methylase subunit YeeA [Allopseudospirillum japonicum]|uniref:site-specific DNA-methyltransferase (adenine-specific) n=1 Tax=Allopseudospirillum japonicum TaxID=64971 RepID=A0A1H6S5J7_9GAMM|nr:DNA methyltransferase [Allopseudospirillum japonicum]SEI63169.1 Type II restriction/modification system, DNA methylase subunit YeeA [Allopseudospirillum japonicum]
MAISQARIIESLAQACNPLNPDELIFSFLDAYGFPKSTITRLRKGGDSRNLAEGEDIALKKKLYFRALAQGSDLEAEAEALKASELVTRNDIRFVMVTDFVNLVALDLQAEESLHTPLEKLDKQYAFFLPLAGYEKAIMYAEHPADVKASEKMGQLFDLIRERNELSKPEDIHALNVFLTRLLFCFYAEDTGIFAQGQVTSVIQSTTREDGADLDQFFMDLFTVLNLEQEDPKRNLMPAHFQAFPYVNGGLFHDKEPIPEFGRKARRILLDCGSLDWSEINPDIFGSMFQAVIDKEQRGNLGQHYTSVSNIMKVIQPLFLDKLYAELEKSRKSENKLKGLLLRLQNLRIFDPACGSGNFLIIAYKELRKLEMEVIDALNSVSDQPEIYYSGIRLSQFFGIEIDDFAHEVAVLSLWLAEHQMNMAFKAKFGYAKAALPLRDSGHIVCGNALRLDWQQVCPPLDTHGNTYEVYLCGNPPFLGSAGRSQVQNEDMAYVFSEFKSFGMLDFVACWFWKSSQYISERHAEFALVSTNSICQGEQVATLWPSILGKGLKIRFAYPTFAWKNQAKQNAAVHVVVVGVANASINQRSTLFKVQDGKNIHRVDVDNINPYLLEGGDIVIESRSKPLCSVPEMLYGNKPIDGGHLLLNTAEKNQLIQAEPQAARWIKQLMGAQEFIQAKERWCLWLVEATLEDIEAMPLVKQRVEAVRETRLASRDAGARKLAERPHQFRDLKNPESFILVPAFTSERRPYVPIGFFGAETISNNKNYMIPNGTLYEFGVLESEMHMDWMRTVCGRLESRYGYSVTLVYNTFPWPQVTEQQRKQIEALAEEVLLIREDYPGKSLANLYDPDKMPEPLLKAHQTLDRAVEKLYRDKPFRDASERLEHLFARYEKLIAAEKAQAPAKKKSTRSK